MKHENRKQRTKAFALQVIHFVEALPKDETTHTFRRQLLRAGTSVGANYRAACSDKSRADFVSKMGTIEEEADESGYWLELLVDPGKAGRSKAAPLMKESSDRTAIAVNTAREHSKQAQSQKSAQNEN